MYYRSNDEVVRGYYHEQSESGRNGNGSLYFEGDILYSYGEHFPLAIKTDEGKYIVNGDNYSSTTSAHRSIVFAVIPNTRRIEIPFSALLESGIAEVEGGIWNRYYGTDNIKKIKILDYVNDRWVDTGQVNKYGEVIYDHVLGAALIEYGGKKYLSGIDETGTGYGTYFLTLLVDDDVETLEEAYTSLKPEIVRLAEQEGIDVKRQGEYFFIPVLKEVHEELEKSTRIEKNGLLKGENDVEGHHMVTRYINYPGLQYAKGTVRHTRGEHKMLRLYELGDKDKDKLWHLVVHNRQVNSWNASGGID